MRLRLPKLPSPKDLGWSEHNALGSRELTPYQEGKTWEDWDDHCRAHYPVRYFLIETLPMWLNEWFVWPFRRARRWILDRMPGRRYHVLDLRGVDPLSNYRAGYLDPCEVFRLAGWASLMRWHRESERHGHHKDPRKWATEEDLKDPGLRDQRDRFIEACDLVHYWTIVRVERDQESTRLRGLANAIEPTAENQEAYEAAEALWLAYWQESERLEDEMWLRLAVIRNFLWD